MDISSVNSDLIRGNVTTIILGSLWSGDRYGYDILREIEEKSGGQYKLKQPTLYNQLKRLEKQGLISSYDGDPEDTGGGKRRYYTLTAEGRAFLQKERSEYEYSRTILDRLVSDRDFDFTAPAPFNAEELRPYAKKDQSEKPKVVYKEKVIERKIFLDAHGNEITEEEAERLRLEAEEEARRQEELRGRPAMSLKELFERIETKSEYTGTDKASVSEPKADFGAPEPKQETAPAPEASQKTAKEVFDEIARREADMDSKNQIPTAEAISQEAAADLRFFSANVQHSADEAATRTREAQLPADPDPSPSPSPESREYAPAELQPDASRRPILAEDKGEFVTAAVIGRRETAFDFERDEVNYREFFSSIAAERQPREEKPEEPRPAPVGDGDIKTRLYAEGFKLRPYDKGNTSEYYTFNFIQSNRIGRDCWLIVFAIFALELAVMWLSLARQITYVYFLPILLVCGALMLLPTLLYMINPTKRVRANFNFKMSLLNRGMMFIELTVVAILIGFFAVGASVTDTTLILMTIVIPAILLTNLPVSSVVYWLLYRSKRYHTA